MRLGRSGPGRAKFNFSEGLCWAHMVPTPDQEVETFEDEDECKVVRRCAHWDRRNKMGVIKGFTEQRQEKRLSVSNMLFWRMMSCLHILIMIFSLGKRLLLCCATCLKRSSWKLYKILPRVSCRSSCRTFLLLLRQQLFQYQQVPVGSASRLRGGNQAKKACSFEVSVFGSHVGPGSAKTDSFLRPPPTSSFTGVVAGTGMACLVLL